MINFSPKNELVVNKSIKKFRTLGVVYRRFAQCIHVYTYTESSRLGDPDVAGDAGGHLALARAETNGGQLAPRS